MDLFIHINNYIKDVNFYFVNDTRIKRKNVIEFTTVYNDLNVIPTHWYETDLAQSEDVQKLASWLNKNVFQLMINNLIWKEKLDCTTELVKKRIFTNLLDKSQISKADKLIWDTWVNDLYWARKQAITDYYLDFIVKLPF